MNSAPNPLPSLGSIFGADLTMQRALKVVTTGLVLAVGTWMMIQPQPYTPQPVETPVEAIYGPWVIAGALVLAALGLLAFVWRYLFVKKLFSEGKIIKGTVDATEYHDTNMHSNTSKMQTRATYVHYVTIRYAVLGADRKMRFRLAHSPSTYGIRKDEEVDLLLLDSAPNKPILRAVYVWRNRR